MTEYTTTGIADAVIAAGGRQEDLAKQLGVSQQVVGQWVKKGWVPSTRIVEIEALYGIPRVRLINPKHLTILAPVKFEG